MCKKWLTALLLPFVLLGARVCEAAPALSLSWQGHSPIELESLALNEEDSYSCNRISLSVPQLPSLVFEQQPQSLSASVACDGTVLWKGVPSSLSEAGSYSLPGDSFFHRNGEYLITVTVDQETLYRIPMQVSCRPQFSMSASSAYIGGCVLLRADFLEEDTQVTAETNLGFTPTFYDSQNGKAALLPLKNSLTPGTYSVTIRAGDVVCKASLQALDPQFKTETFSVSSSVADSTVNSDTANNQFEATTRPLKNMGLPSVFWNSNFIIPVHQETLRVSSSYGYTRIVNGGEPDRHGGVDLPAATGTPVMAANNGQVLFAGFLQLTGNTVVLEHGCGLKTWYYHMNSLNCKTGDTVRQGQQIGAVGTTGYSTGPHLHFGMSVNNIYINPWQFINGVGFTM